MLATGGWSGIRGGLVAAHRGARRLAPENTLAAFRAALALGARALELDVHLTADEEIVVIHDDLLDRTTDATGPVCRFRSGELRDLDAGSWFAPQFAGERLPLLEHVVRLAESSARLLVELKGPGGAALAACVARLVERHDAYDRLSVMSFDLDAAIAAARISPRLRVLAIVGEPLADQLAFVRAAGLGGLNQPARCWSGATIVAFHEQDLVVHGSLVDDPPTLAAFLACGGDLADSDNPACFAPS
ncbi:MAG TPA: glycerophosphodiester phosphodiesterase family protein [Acidimicrobiales bacterium]|nr:glycerophosphodiester phosphodiesterase family protein [Acidimicrobiales bacterium]